MIYLDTHITVWLFEGEIDVLSSKVINLLEQQDLLVSPMVSLEMQYLYEAKRIRHTPAQILQSLENSMNLQICDQPFGKVIQTAIEETWTRDPFDRVITAQAKLSGSTLISRDEKIQKHYKNCVWI